MIDEADGCSTSVHPDVRRIVYQTPRKRERQTLFFSATFNDDVMNLAKQWTFDPVHVAIEPETVAAEAVEQRFWMLSSKDKRGTILRFLEGKREGENGGQTLVFVNRRDEVHRLVRFLQQRGIDCEGLSGDIPNASAWPRSIASRRARCPSSSPPTWPVGEFTSRASPTSSTTTCRRTPRTTCTASAAPAAPRHGHVHQLRHRERRVQPAGHRGVPWPSRDLHAARRVSDPGGTTARDGL